MIDVPLACTQQQQTSRGTDDDVIGERDRNLSPLALTDDISFAL
jgi:hypothetical protein